MMPRTVSASRISRTSSFLGIKVTCPPSPCGRLSRPRTTTGTPLPWGSPSEGQSRAALIRHVLARVRSSTHPYARTRCPMSHSRATTGGLRDLGSSAVTLSSVLGRAVPEPSIDGHDYRRSQGDALWRAVFCCQPGLDFKQSSFDHVARALQSVHSAGGLPSAFPAGFVPPGLVGYG
jgi:hypothetical protein